jgi:hypothetical protein
MMTKTQSIIASLLAKEAMHGYPDYQMTEPQQPPVPQQSLPAYDNEEQEPEQAPEQPSAQPEEMDTPEVHGLLAAIEAPEAPKQAEDEGGPAGLLAPEVKLPPWNWVMGGGMGGGVLGQSLTKDDLAQTTKQLDFLQGKPESPIAHNIVMDRVQRGLSGLRTRCITLRVMSTSFRSSRGITGRQWPRVRA